MKYEDEFTIQELCEHFSKHSERFKEQYQKHSIDFPESMDTGYFNLPKALLKICESIQKLQEK